MKRVFWITFILAIMGTSFVVAGETPPEFKVDQEASNYPTDRSVRDEIDAYLGSKGYNMGDNSRESGGDFFIAIGTGTIQASRKSPNYLSSRINAFEKAMAVAKKQMVQSIGIKIQKDLLIEYTEGEDPVARKNKEAEAMKSPSILDKTTALVNAKLDQMLADEGVDLSKPAPVEKVQQIVSSEIFEKFTRTVANARVVGMQAMKVFEASPDGNKGQIGVITVYSEKLHKMADAMFSGSSTNLPQGSPKQPIINQIPSDKLVLLSTFGVQQKTDENGRLVLVAFGQGIPKTNSPRSLDAAYGKAKINAMDALRSFAGEIAAVENDVYEFESVQELEGGMEQYENESYYKDKIKTYAAALKISGIATIKRWEAVHPLVNKRVAGVVIAWSPSSAAKAQKRGAKMATQPQKKSGSSSQPKNEVYKSGSNQGGSYRGSGAAADDDSF